MKRLDLLCGACAVVASLGAAKAGVAQTAPAHWNHESGDLGPSHWGDLQPDFKACSLGLQQSPIDLRTPVAARIGALSLAYKATPLHIENTGHTIQVNYAPGSMMTTRGRTYEVVQFHFHTPSEHTVDGKRFPLELHVVHSDTKKNLAVVGVFFEPGAESKALELVTRNAPSMPGPEVQVPGGSINAIDLISSTSMYYEYLGSLTTPPCSEGVKWILLGQPNRASAAQIAKLQSIMPRNARPIQQLNQRLLLENGA